MTSNLYVGCAPQRTADHSVEGECITPPSRGTQGIRPHLPNSGVCGHSAGDIFPYIIVLVGKPDNIKYHVIGQGRTVKSTLGMYNFEAALTVANNLINQQQPLR